jgi:hypothetical protein
MTLAVVALAVGIAALALGARSTPAEPIPTGSPESASATESTAPTAVPVQAAPVSLRVWFARNQLPPVRATVLGSGGPGDRPEGRILLMIGALRNARPEDVPAGAFNAMAQVGTFQGSQSGFEVGARVQGDLVTVELGRGQFDRIRGAAMTQAVVQQLVYTASDVDGIRRVLLTERGGGPLTIDQLVINKQLTREDVTGYSFAGTETTSIVSDGAQIPTTIASMKVMNEDVPGLGRFSVEIAGGGSAGGRLIPRLKASLTPCDCQAAKWLLRLDLPDTVAPNPKIPFEQFAGPITTLDSPHTRTPADVGAIFLLGLDDARLWRVSVESTTAGTTRINVDVGGRPEWITRSIAVYALEPGTAGRGLTLRGAARVFEAAVSWRFRDASGREAARGSTTATIGTSAVWGTFETAVEIPAGTGPGDLEVFWVSPRDGTEQDVVSIALGVR